MRVIDYDWNKRNGNGHSTCHLCNTLTWDSFCYDFELKILDKELFNTVLCGDCILKIKQELECKMSSNEEIIEEVEDEEYEDTEELDVEYDNDGKLSRTINALIRNQKKIIEKINDNK